MGLLCHLVFLFVYVFLIDRYGDGIQYHGLYPSYFVYVVCFSWSKHYYPYLIITVMLTGWCTDLFHQHPWASDAAFFCGSYVIADRVNLCRLNKKLTGFWPSTMVMSCCYHLWNLWLYHDRMIANLFDQMVIDAAIAPFFFLLFKQIRLGWFQRGRPQSFPVINA